MTRPLASRLAPWAVLALLPLGACATNQSDPMAATLPTPAPTVPSTSAQDQSFVVQAAGSDQFEIQSSQLALRKTRSPAVRRFAERMVHDHTIADSKLATLASQKGVSMPAALDPPSQEKLARLQDASGRSFVRAYAADQVSGHRTAVEVYKAEIVNGTDTDLKAFAQETLPIIQQHLMLARRLP